LLERVVEEVDIPIFAFDPREKLRLVNSAGERLLQQRSRQALGSTASDLGLENCLSGESESLVELHLGTNARWFVRRSSFRQQGIPHTLVVLSDVSRALREEERKAWQRLIRVLGHELNNSLAPIKSIAGSLNARLPSSGVNLEEQQDFERGLNIIATRAASLSRFLDAYRKLAQMPPPVVQRCAISTLARRVASLETRVPVEVVSGPDIVFLADADQLEQMLINLVRNAAESVLQAGEENANSNGSKERDARRQIVLSWKAVEETIVIAIEDDGVGLMNPANVFVPFYTTKPQGSGIGLVLSRQIAEAHGGTMELSNRTDRRGCTVKVTLPLRIMAAGDRRTENRLA
jgi:nitrogen fixation/metabolism regulation signal transduction histidine kinase